jgi:hypothetical protein
MKTTWSSTVDAATAGLLKTEDLLAAKAQPEANQVYTPAVETPVATKEVPAASEPKAKKTPQAKATKTGAKYHVLAGRPSKHAVIAVFGKTGYGYSWVKRAELLNETPEDLTAMFATDPKRVKAAWEKLAADKPKAAK